MKEQNEEIKQENQKTFSFASIEEFVERNKKIILIIAAVIVAIVLIIFGLKKFYFEPREVAAQEQMFAAENWFMAGEYQKALEGNDQYSGFNEVIDEFSCTKSGNLAHYYAAICELRLGNAEAALKHLNKYKGHDEMTSTLAIILEGDAQWELGQVDEALKCYEKAAKKSDDAVTTPAALHKAGMIYLSKGDKDNAVKCFESIKQKYPTSTEAQQEVDKLLGVANAQ